MQQTIMAHVMQVYQFIHLQVDNMYDKYDKFNFATNDYGTCNAGRSVYTFTGR
jgi:hypothetical protein